MRHENELPKLEHSVNVNGWMINVSAIQHCRKGTVSPDQISCHWRISLKHAKDTYEAITQLGVRNFTGTQGVG